jgi:hypothetical protein
MIYFILWVPGGSKNDGAEALNPPDFPDEKSDPLQKGVKTRDNKQKVAR